jgi:putative hydrolase
LPSPSNWSDGGADIDVMARAARDLGHEYIVLTDHSPRLTVANGLDRERSSPARWSSPPQRRAQRPFRILTGIEVDILEDGSSTRTTTSSSASTWWSPACTRSCGWTARR